MGVQEEKGWRSFIGAGVEGVVLVIGEKDG